MRSSVLVCIAAVSALAVGLRAQGAAASQAGAADD